MPGKTSANKKVASTKPAKAKKTSQRVEAEQPVPRGREKVFDKPGKRMLSEREAKRIVGELAARDKKLGAVMEQVGKFNLNLEETDTVFGAVAQSIIYQQLSGKVAATIYLKFKRLFGSDDCPGPRPIIEAPDTVLRSAGLSNAKMLAIQDLARREISGEIPALEEIIKLSDAEIVDCLVKVRGVGLWTAQMFLMFRLGRLDVMPSTDYGIRKGFGRIYNRNLEKLPSPSDIEAHASKKWAPYRTVASWYLWRALELD